MRAPVCRLSDIRLPSGMTWVQTLSVKKNPHCSSKRVGDLDPGVVVYLSYREREGAGGDVERGLLDPLMLNMTSSSSSLSLLFIHGKNNQAKYTICNILKMFTNYRINGNSIYKDEC